ncbi:RNA polymerase Rpc34 [Bisporella sp. PMI_857]|nr:RNA polymerase Rpc34 [Bisporella sp. PMI_857]
MASRALIDSVYDHFEEHADTKATISQEEILGSGLIANEDFGTLLEVVNALLGDCRFKVVERLTPGGGKTNDYRVRSPEAARIYRSLNGEQRAVYGYIDESGQDGIWNKYLKQSSGLHEAVFNNIIKHLVAQKLIKDIKSVEHPTRKIYIKVGVEQSERSKGGAWYTDGVLDEALLAYVTHWLTQYIRNSSMYMSSDALKQLGGKQAEKPPREPKKGRKKGTVADERQIEDAKALRAAEIIYDGGLMPMPAGYQEYPDLQELTEELLKAGLVKDVVVEAKDLKEVLDNMVLDDVIETVRLSNGGEGYKTARQSLRPITRGPFNILTEAPCGRCPVFDFCEEGGPVGPSNCQYFQEWLKM